MSVREARERLAATLGARGHTLRAEWMQMFERYRAAYPELAEQLYRMQHRELPDGWDKALAEFPADAKGLAGRDASAKVLNVIAQNVPWKEANFRLKGGEITDAALKDIGQVSSLVDLRLGTTKVTDAGLVEVAKLEQLQALGLELTGISDTGLAQLKVLKNLVYLNLYGTQVTDAGLDNLRDMKHLRSLYLWQTKVTPEGVKKLQDALPLLMIDTGAKLVIPEKLEEPKKEEKKEEKK